MIIITIYKGAAFGISVDDGREQKSFMIPKRYRPHLIAGATAVIALGGFLWLNASPVTETTGGGQDEAPVYVEKALQGPIDVSLKALGTVTPLATISVRSRVSGELVQLRFEEGQHVAKGQLLAEIDPRTFRAGLAQTLGERTQSAAQLERARKELERHRQLDSRGFTTRTMLDEQAALVAQHEGAIAASEGRIADARLQLSFTSIRAPISGRIGLRGVDTGNLVQADVSEVAVITQMQPISVIFTIPETQIGEVRAAMRDNRPLVVEAWDRSERVLLGEGQLSTIDNRIDPASGTLRLRGVFPNADEALFPNQFVNIRLKLRTIADAVTIPSSAIQHGASGPFAYVLDNEGLAQRSVLKLGASDGDRTEVVSGIAANIRVVTQGVDGLKDGKKTVVVPETSANGAASGSSR